MVLLLRIPVASDWMLLRSTSKIYSVIESIFDTIHIRSRITVEDMDRNIIYNS